MRHTRLLRGIALAVGVAAVWPGRAKVGPPPAGFAAVKLTAEDGVTLAGWGYRWVAKCCWARPPRNPP